jgi:hypothetical protein
MLVLECGQKIPPPKVIEARVSSFDGQKYLEVKGDAFAFHDLVFDSREGDVFTFRSHSMPDRKISIIAGNLDDLIKALTC